MTAVFLPGSAARTGSGAVWKHCRFALALILAVTVFPAIDAAASTPSFAQASIDHRLDPQLRALIDWRLRNPNVAGTEFRTFATGVEAASGLPGVPVMIRGDVDRVALEAAGALPQTQAGVITTALVPLEALPAVLSVPGVEEVAASARVEPQLDVSADEIDAVDVWGGPPPTFNGFTGAGVILGIVDTGLDLDHQDFRKSNGKTRVRFLWDQTAIGSGPSGFSYGVEYTETQINGGSVTQTDNDGHGTHIAGIAAGNGRATGNGEPAYRYVGIAPESDLVVVKSLLLEANVIDGVDYIFQKAASLGRDAVALVAVGNHRGGHDGSSNMASAISALTGPGKLVAAAAGNDGDESIHASINLGNNQSTTINAFIPSYSPSPVTWEFLEIEGWHESNASFDVKLTSPSGFTTNWVTPGNSSGVVSSNDGGMQVDNAQITNSKGAKRVRVFVWDRGDGNKPEDGTWKIDVKRRSGTSSGVMHAWVSSWRFGSGGVSPDFSNHVDMSMLVMSPATGDQVISAGAYTTKRDWTNVNGTPSFYVENPPMWAIADFSSMGPRRDGVFRPDVAAPGYGVVAALSEAVSGITSNVWKVEDGVHRIRFGTSMAAAHVAGGLALLLDETPDLTPSQARDLIVQRARSDSYTGSVPNAAWGHGKLDLAGGTVAVGDGPIGSFQLAPVFPNPTRDGASFQFVLGPEQLDAGGPVRLRIFDVRGRELALVNGELTEGQQRLTWDGRASNGVHAAPGVYLGRLEVGDEQAERKFVRLP